MIRKSARGVVGAAWACALLAGCYSPTAKVEADAMAEEDRVTYLVLTDQLERVRNIFQRPAKVCLGLLPGGRYRGLTPVPPYVVERLEREQADLEPQLEITAEIECLAYYVEDKAFFTPETSDVLAYAGALGEYSHGRHCGDWIGGLHQQGGLNRGVNYDVEIEDGIAKLVGGEDCGAIRWYRS